MVSTKNKKKSTSFFLLFLSVFIASGIFSCRRDSTDPEPVNFQVDFLINNFDVPSTEEYTPDDLTKNDSLYSLRINEGSLISFQDITEPSGRVETREWSIKPFGADENIEGKRILSTAKNFEHRASERGRFEIALWVNGSDAGIGKTIDVLDEIGEDYVIPFPRRDGEYVEVVEPQHSEEEENGIDNEISEKENENLLADYKNETKNNKESKNTSYTNKIIDNQEDKIKTEKPEPYQNEPDLTEKGPSARTPVSRVSPVTDVNKPTKPNKPVTPETSILIKKIPTISRVRFDPSTTLAKVGDKVNFEDKSEDKSIIRTRVWDFGDGTKPKVVEGLHKTKVSHVFTKTGEYIVKLCLNNLPGECTNKKVKIIAEKPLFASVDFDIPTVIYAGESIRIKDKSSPQNNVTNRYWDFGDKSIGRTANKAEITYTYPKANSYTIKLCLNDKNGKDGKDCITKKITVINRPPKPEPVKPQITQSDIKINTSKKNGEVGESFNFSDNTNKTISKREWYIGSQLIGSGKTFNHTFKEAGTYKIKLCLEGNKSLCKDIDVVIKDKEIIKDKPIVGDPFDFELNTKGTASYASSKKCETATKKTEGVIKMVVSKRTLLDEMTVFTDASGSITITLSYKSKDGRTIKDSISKYVNTGRTQVGLSDFGIVLMPDNTFNLSIEADSGINLLDSSSCGGNPSQGKAFSLSGNTGLAHDLKYYY